MTADAIEATSVKTHETVWSGVLTPAQIEDLLIKGLREALNTPYSGLSLNVVRVEPAADGAATLPTIHYDLVHDHDHWLKTWVSVSPAANETDRA